MDTNICPVAPSLKAEKTHFHTVGTAGPLEVTVEQKSTASEKENCVWVQGKELMQSREPAGGINAHRKNSGR